MDAMRLRLTALVVAGFIALAPLAARGPSGRASAIAERSRTPAARAAQDGAVPTFSVRSHIVLLHVNVLDSDGRALDELDASAFEVYEDGRPQKIEFFELRDAPLAAGLVIDSSSSMLTQRVMVRAGVDAFASLSQPRDELFTIVFNEHVRLGLPPGVAFTRSPDMLRASLGRAGLGGKTALYDAVIEGLSHLEAAMNPKRVLVILSDGDDNASEHSKRNMLYRAGQSSAVIHTIWSGELSANRGDPGLLRDLAESNGGESYHPEDASDMVETFETIARSIRRGYTIGYAPTNSAADGTYRRIKVLVRADRDAKVLVREGYTAPDDAVAAQ